MGIGFPLFSRHRRRLKKLVGPNTELLFYNIPALKAVPDLKAAIPDELKVWADVFDNSLIDRTGTLDMGQRFEMIDPLPDGGRALLAGPRLELADLCAARARQILDEAAQTGSRIEVLWSGGIDSTTALLSLMHEAEKRDETDRLSVLHNKDSIKEYPWLYKNVLRRKLTLKPFKGPVAGALDLNCLNVTGEMGDQLFGSAKAEKAFRSGSAHHAWSSTLPPMIEPHCHRGMSPERVIEWIKPLIDKAPTPIETTFELLWWLNFTTKWQLVDLRIAAGREKDAKRCYQQMRHFFRSSGFQAWSLQNPDKKVKENWQSYKWPLKQLIGDWTGDPEYVCTKRKVPSLRDTTAKGLLAKATVITSDFDLRRAATLASSGGSNG